MAVLKQNDVQMVDCDRNTQRKIRQSLMVPLEASLCCVKSMQKKIDSL